MNQQRPFISFAEVKRKISIPDVLNIFGITGQFASKGNQLTGVCPLPQHKHGPRPNKSQFRIHFVDGTWLYKCFGDCADTPGGAGDVITFVKAMTGLSDAHVRFWFADHFGDRLSNSKAATSAKPLEKEEARESLARTVDSQAPNVIASVAADTTALKPLRFTLNLDPTVPYLRERGLSDPTIRRFGLGLCTRGLLNGYIAIPVFNWPRADDERPVAYLGRWPSNDFDEADGRPRYKWPEGFPKQRLVYALHEALRDSDGNQPLVIVEGTFGVYHLAQNGYLNAVAIFGSNLSDDQAAILLRTRRSLILMFDGDEAGRSGMRSAAAKLIKSSFVRVAMLPNGTQPDQLSKDQLRAMIH